MQAVSYFLEKSRLSGREYTDRFLDIIQNPVGEPLLRQVAASQDRILALLEGAAPKEGGMVTGSTPARPLIVFLLFFFPQFSLASCLRDPHGTETDCFNA